LGAVAPADIGCKIAVLRFRDHGTKEMLEAVGSKV